MSITTDGNVKVTPEFLGQKTLICAKSGYGKSYTARVIIEEAGKIGASVIVIDPQDAYLNIPGFDYINAHEVKSAKMLGQLLAATSRRVVLRTKRLTIGAQNAFVAAFLTEYRRNLRKGIQTIIIDEAHKFAPESENTVAKEVVRGMFQENRSDGLGAIAISQRISRLDKTIISQTDNQFFGRVTAFRDTESIRHYLDDEKDIEKIKKLQKGDFFIIGVQDEPIIGHVREAETKHSGDSPKHLINEDTQGYEKHIGRVVTRRTKAGEPPMSDAIAGNDTVKNVIPSMEGFGDLAFMGVKMGFGGAIAGVAGAVVGSRLRSPLPVVSSRTLGAAGSTVALYAAFRMAPDKYGLKDAAKYAAAGSAAFTMGSLFFDVLAATKVRLPGIVQFAVATGTGASPVSAEAGAPGVDTNTAMA